MDLVITSQPDDTLESNPNHDDDNDSGNYSSSEDEGDNGFAPSSSSLLGDEWTLTNVVSGVVGFITASTIRQRLHHIGGSAFWLSTATLLVQFNVISVNWPLIDRYTRFVSRKLPRTLKKRMRMGWLALMQVPVASFFVGGFCLGAQFG